MELLFEIVFSFLFEIVFALFAGAAEIALYKTHKRFWMWVVGVAAVSLMIWWRGAELWTTWLIAGGWVAALVWLDRRLTAESPETRP